MSQILLIFVIALTFSMLATPLARRVALRAGVISVPRSTSHASSNSII